MSLEAFKLIGHGVGNICATNDGFDIELWQIKKKEIIHKKG
jgi:hypothetical protein